MNNYFKYKRISTKEERGLQKYNRQEAALNKYAAENGIEFVAEFQEDVSGKSFDNRKEWNRLEKLVQPGDTIVFKDISRFTREANNGYNKYMELLERGIELVFIDNPTVSTAYIKQLLNVAEQQNIVARTSLESTVKLLIIVELDRVEQERLILINRIKCGISASEKQQGRKPGQLDKMTAELEADIKAFLGDRSIKQVDLMEKHKISRNTLKKYIELVKENS
ncbi:MAG: recombinase family protein [Clostridia bacterium]|nr:recombinase family protein [Clostridia bacterium]MBO5418103.1 recombinase family protein [Clostridia bacterium]